MYDYEIQRGDNKETHEITGIEDNSLLIVRDHPTFGRGGVASKIYIRDFIDRMNNGKWVWA